MPNADEDCDWKAESIENEDGDGEVAVLVKHRYYFLAVGFREKLWFELFKSSCKDSFLLKEESRLNLMDLNKGEAFSFLYTFFTTHPLFAAS